MRDNIYGPLYQKLRIIQINLENNQNPDGDLKSSRVKEMEEIMGHYLFSLVNENTKISIRNVHKDLSNYNEMLLKVEKEICIYSNAELDDKYPRIGKIDPNEIRVCLKDKCSTLSPEVSFKDIIFILRNNNLLSSA